LYSHLAHPHGSHIYVDSVHSARCDQGGTILGSISVRTLHFFALSQVYCANLPIWKISTILNILYIYLPSNNTKKAFYKHPNTPWRFSRTSISLSEPQKLENDACDTVQAISNLRRNHNPNYPYTTPSSLQQHIYTIYRLERCPTSLKTRDSTHWEFYEAPNTLRMAFRACPNGRSKRILSVTIQT
jgi:hypothetical protein